MARETSVTLKVKDGYSKQFQDFQGGLNKSAGAASSFGSAAMGAAKAGLGALEAGLVFSIKAAIEAEQVMAKTEAVIKSTGGAAGLTADDVSDLATEFSNLSGIDDELIQSAENVMLTFTAIGREAFPQAMEAALNMSVALGTDLQGAVIQVGKALQDPIQGLTALRRVGVNFNDAAKETIKQMVAFGDVAGAQAFILKELETEFGGVAAAAGDTLAGKLGRAEVAVGNLAEKIGGALVPILGDAAEAALTLINWTENLDKLFAEHNKNVADTADSYVEYRAEMERAAQAAGLVAMTQDEVDEAMRGIILPFADVTHHTVIMSEALFNARKASEDYAHGLTEADFAMQALGTTTTNTTASLQTLTGAEDLLTLAAQKLTAEFIFQKASQDLDASAALSLGLAMGVLSEETINTVHRLEILRATYDTNKDGAISAAEAARGYNSAVVQLGASVGALEDKTITVTTRFETIGEPPPVNIFDPDVESRRQHGGRLGRGQAAIVGEAGPEIFVPQQGGFVVNQQQAAQAAAGMPLIGSIVVNNAAPGMDVNGLVREIEVAIAARSRAFRQAGAAFLGV